MLTSSGINANVALLSTVGGPGDVLLVDAHAHASVHAGAAASRGRTSASGTTTSARSERLEPVDPRAGAVVVVDGVYSMTGETRPARRDRRHLCDRTAPGWWSTRRTGSGVLGERGRGAASRSGVLDRVDAVTVALSKSLASVGGAIMTRRAAADGIRASAMPYVFSAANDPASVGAALAALRILRSEPERMAPAAGATARCCAGR